jgi:parallel beta-helix repeat protein
MNNSISHNAIGIQLGGRDCKIYGNTLTYSTSYGIYATGSNNEIYKNHFSKNTISNAIERGNNQWDSGEEGNYWDDYNDVDRDLDGIGDYPYRISGGGIDRYPTGRFLQPPNKPTDPSPKDGASNVGLSPTLQVKVSDPDSESLSVYFYKAMDDSLIAERHGIASGGIASCTFNIPYDTVMAWYVVVNDSKLDETSDIWTFTTLPIPPTNKKPIADPGGPYTGEVNQPIHFDGTKSSDPDGTISFYRWNFGDGSGEILDPSPIHVYKERGIYSVTLTVIDNDGTSVTALTTATVGAVVNKAPEAKLWVPDTGKVNEVIVFNGSESYDLDGRIESYFWNFGDGESTSGRRVIHSYSSAGNYTVTLTVTDNNGSTDSATAFIIITEEKKTPGFEAVFLFIVLVAISIVSKISKKERKR